MFAIAGSYKCRPAELTYYISACSEDHGSVDPSAERSCESGAAQSASGMGMSSSFLAKVLFCLG